MQSNLKELLDKIYELEGLVHLSLKREEDADDFCRLISKKGKEVGDLCLNIGNSVTGEFPQTPSENTNFVLEEYSLDDDNDPDNIMPLLSQMNHTQEDSTLIYDSQDYTSKNTDKLSSVNDVQRGKLVFSINERFRFKRELFDNSDADFNNTLALVASMDNYDEAEEYFFNEEGFDAANPVVKEFMLVIKKYFS